MGHATMPAELAEIIETHHRLFGGFTMSAPYAEHETWWVQTFCSVLSPRVA